jgi:hypothetical protein
MNFQNIELNAICNRLTKYDSQIVEIIQFGSSVYAPESARDLDILVFTEQKKDYSGYLNAVDESELPYEIDVVINDIESQVSKEFAVSVFGANKVLYGDGHCLEKQLLEIDPTYEEASVAIEAARNYMSDAQEAADNKLLKDRHIKTAFNELFHASRLAVMTYLSTEESRWGRLKRELPQPYQEQFREYIDTLHVDYFYRGKYPTENVEAEFERWTSEVQQFIMNLEAEGS